MPDNTLRARFGAVVGKLPSKFWLPTMGLLVAACITASEVPKPSAFNTLVPKAADSNDAQGAFTVVHHGPVDVAATDATINLVFSKPLRTLDAHDEDAPIAINLTPSIEGKWHWVGTHGVQFHPTAGRLPLGKKIHVSVPAALTAVSGEQLGKPLEFSFATSTPRLEEFEPNDGATSQALKPNISLRFDQAVDPRELAEKTRLRVAGKAVEFTLAMDSNNDAKRWLLTPKNALPRATQVHVEVQAGLRSVGGDVPSPHAHNFSFYTYAPLTATARCGWSECAPESSVSIELSNAVTLAELKQRVSITPAVALEWPDWYDADTSSTSFTFTFKGKPRTSYQLNIARGLTDEFGQELQGPNSFTFHTSDYWSSLSVGVSGQILQPTTLRAVPVRSRNVASYDLTVTPANEQTVLQYQRHQWDAPELATTSGVLQRVNPGITNRFHDQLVDLTPALSRKNGDAQAPARGAVLFTTSYTPGKGSSPTAERKLVQVTDLGLTAKLTKRGTVVWVTRMSTGQPLPGASVELWHDKELRHTYLTDADGITTIPQDAFVPRFYEEGGRYGLVARFEGDWIAQAENTFLGAWRLPVYPELYPTDTKTTYLFTERGVYRPGDKVWVKGIVREEADTRAAGAGGMVAVADRQFELQLFDPNDTAIVTTAVKTNTFGTFAYQLTVPESAALGSFRVTLKDPSQQAPAYDLPTAYFAVAEYEPAEFSVAASAERNSYITGSKATFSVHSEFLYGSPVSAGDVHYTITYEPSNFTPPNSADYETTDNAYQSGRDSQVPNYGLVVEGDNKLDAAGTLRVQQQLQVQGQTSPLNIRFESSVTDVARKTISGSTHTLLHPADFYLGLKRLEDWFVSAPSAFRPQVVAFSSSGQRVVGKTVQLELVRRRWASVREVWEQGYRQVYNQLDDVVTRCTLRTAQAEQSCDLALTEGGNYVVRATSTDDKGRVVYASSEFYAIGNGRADWRDDAVNAQMDIVANKKEYRVGETARILVKSPFTRGEALVTVERAGIIEKRRMTLKGGTPVIEIPITDAMRPNAFVSVHLLKTRTATSGAASAGDEMYRIGYTELRLDASQRKLDVVVTPKQGAVRPRDKVVVDVHVKDASGRGKMSEVTFYAVDEGVLMLTGYQLPDPVARFTAPRPLKVATIESRSDLARIFEPLSPNGSEKGAEGGDGGGARSDFKQSAYFNPNVVTDEQGRARVEFQAPDNLTTFRLIAVAVSKDDRYGGGQSKVVVDKPLMARPAIPRFLRAGDRFEAAVSVSTKASKSKSVAVFIKVGGGLTLEGADSQNVAVTSDGVKEVRFPVSANATGNATIDFTVQSEVERDSVHLMRPVHSPAQLETVAAYGETRGVDGQRLGKLDAVRPDMGGLQVTLAASRLVGLSGSMEALVEYPYYCTEQLSSRLLPLLPLGELAKTFGFDSVPDARGFSERTVRLIVERQRHDGGFGFWLESDSSHPYVSAYALWTLKLASRHGVKVSPDVFNRGLTYLRSIVNNTTSDDAELEKHGLSLDLQAFSAMVMGELEAADVGAIERLMQKRKDIGLSGHAWLLQAAVRAKAPAALRQPLRERLESAVTLVGNRAVVENADGRYLESLFSSPLKVQALVLDALLTENPQHQLAGKLVAELLWRREGGTWRTTQESAFALLAIDRYWRAQEQETPNFEAKVWVGDKPIVSQPFTGRSTVAVHELSMNTLQASNSLDVVFERAAGTPLTASGTLFYEARLRYASNDTPRSPLDRGFAVQKSIRAVAPAELAAAMRNLGPSVTTIDAKQLAVIDVLVVAANARRFVAIDDPIPSGLTAFDSTLATSSERLSELEATSTGFSSTWSRRELRDDRVLFFADEMPAGVYRFSYLANPHTPGTYLVPPTRVMEMYQPEVYGRTAASTLTVTARQ